MKIFTCNLDQIEQHNVPASCAEQNLAQNPVRDYGVERMIDEARKATATPVKSDVMQWLPDVRLHFRLVEA